MKRILFFLFVLTTAAHAQSIVTGQSEVAGGTVVYGIGSGGTVVEGSSVVSGGTVVDYPYAPGARIFAIFPPSYGSSDYSNFVAHVLSQASIDGVNVSIQWANIEPPSTGTPGSYPPSTYSSTQCAGYPLTGDTDTCVMDAWGRFHSYNWDYYEGTLMGGGCTNTNGIEVWFAGLCGLTTPKIVNLYFVGMNAGPANVSTPEYVTDPYYVNKFTSNPVQDVMNSINVPSGDNCALQQWTGYTSGSPSAVTLTLTAGGTQVNGTPLPNLDWQPNDTIWVNASSGCSTLSSGAALLSVTTTGPTSFTFPNTTGCNPLGGLVAAQVIGASDSFVVPYELPYMTAYRAALKALFLHFTANYQPQGPSTPIVGSQLGYIRFGHTVGGEVYPYCPAYMENLHYPLLGGGLVNNWLCDWTGYTPADATTSPCSSNTDLPNPGFYGGNLKWAQSQNPYMKIYAPLNQFGSGPSLDITYAQREAEQAVMYSTGFGSQGLTLADTSVINGCANAISDWCNAFQMYYANGGGLELQQAGLSDPLDSTCQYPNSIGIHGCATPPQGDSGDLRYWLQFATASHANVIELYYLDAALAFDPNYCTMFTGADGTPCAAGYTFTTSFAYVTPALRGAFFDVVGQGGNCPIGMGGGIGQGDCSYAVAINTAHGSH